ncbi:PD-(D/E)XK nuclease family protein [Novosphingobium sp. TCA1]|uniref:PD-(D/E)XK nuclease family protein n=1 Tax=Novosphingobium sp. TCA1 TaxID=2682474 RepID=UPI0013594DFE|nr:PD-(D/E)XK nuclease family protein [Novosphingobium sp. TCA1]
METAFLALRAVLPTGQPRAPKQFHTLGDLQAAFQSLRGPLATAKARGGLVNPWALANLGHDEVRNAGALAGLWMTEFGGDTSRMFLAHYLLAALPTTNWFEALETGYRVSTEVCPMGDVADRVDLIIETSVHLIGIEVKIRAGLGRDQLERYKASVFRRADLQKRSPRIVLLAPFSADVLEVSSTGWPDIARAARTAAGVSASGRSFVQQMISKFGEHVDAF